jgi:hypothetical protein
MSPVSSACDTLQNREAGVTAQTVTFVFLGVSRFFRNIIFVTVQLYRYAPGKSRSLSKYKQIMAARHTQSSALVRGGRCGDYVQGRPSIL